MGSPVTLTDPDGNYVEILTAGGTVVISGTVPVAGDFLSSAEFVSAIGTTADAAWNLTAPNATVISLLKRIALNTDTT